MWDLSVNTVNQHCSLPMNLNSNLGNAFCLISTGTGINAAFMVDLKDVGTWKGDLNEPQQVVIDMEFNVLLNVKFRVLIIDFSTSS